MASSDSTPSDSPAATPRPARHRAFEDVQAIFTGSMLAAFGILLFKQAGLLSGGTVGLALLLTYATGLSLSLSLIAANLPFYLLAALRLGREFTLKTLVTVALTSVFVAWLPAGIQIQRVEPALAAVLGGLLCGVAILVVFRHRASLGGLNVFVLWLQEKFGFSPGLTQMALDALIVLVGGLWLGRAGSTGASLLAVVTVNLVLAFNHRPGRYHP